MADVSLTVVAPISTFENAFANWLAIGSEKSSGKFISTLPPPAFVSERTLLENAPYGGLSPPLVSSFGGDLMCLFVGGLPPGLLVS